MVISVNLKTTFKDSEGERFRPALGEVASRGGFLTMTDHPVKTLHAEISKEQLDIFKESIQSKLSGAHAAANSTSVWGGFIKLSGAFEPGKNYATMIPLPPGVKSASAWATEVAAQGGGNAGTAYVITDSAQLSIQNNVINGALRVRYHFINYNHPIQICIQVILVF